MLAPQQKYLKERFYDLMHPENKIPEKSGDEIANDIMSRHGLKFK